MRRNTVTLLTCEDETTKNTEGRRDTVVSALENGSAGAFPVSAASQWRLPTRGVGAVQRGKLATARTVGCF
jgi:hypothetical protein